MFISIGFIIVACIIIFISRTTIEQKMLQEKNKDAKMLNFIGYTLLIIGILVWIYGITDTLVEWLIVSLLVSKFLARKIKKIDMVTSLKGNE